MPISIVLPPTFAAWMPRELALVCLVGLPDSSGKLGLNPALHPLSTHPSSGHTRLAPPAPRPQGAGTDCQALAWRHRLCHPLVGALGCPRRGRGCFLGCSQGDRCRQGQWHLEGS